MARRALIRRFSSSLSDLLLLQRKSQQTNVSRPLLHEAVKSNNSVLVKNILDSCLAAVDDEDSFGRTALHYAVQQGSTDMASLLLASGANVDAVDYSGTTPAHMACQEGMIDAMNLLFYYKADMLVVDKGGKTPFDRACEYGRNKMVDRILDSGLDWCTLRRAGSAHISSALHLAARNGHVYICSRLIQCGWPINAIKSQGTALHEAAAYGRIQVVRYLLHVGADPFLLNLHRQTAADVAKKSAAKNPISSKEVRYLLKECHKFVYGKAVQDFSGDSSDELTFSVNDYLWIIEHDPNSPRWKGVIFGLRADSRSGYFASSAVQIVDNPPTVIAMPSRLGARSGISSLQQTPRQVKKVSVPVVPDINTLKRQTCQKSNNRNCYQLGRPFVVHETNSPLESGNYYKNANPASSGALHLPSTSMTALTAPSSLCLSDEPLTDYSLLHGTNGCSMRPGLNPEEECPGNLLSVASPSSFSSLKQRTLYDTIAGHNSDDLSCNGCHRNSTGSNSSHGSSSGFESMKSGSSHGCSTGGTPSANSSNASFTGISSVSPSGILMRGDSPQSRISMRSNSSGGAYSAAHSSANMVEDPGTKHIPPYSTPTLSVSDMVLKGMPEAEILAVWLDSLGHSECLAAFLTQGYDLSTIARITPEDLTALGITQPAHRKLLISEIHKWRITDAWPAVVPSGELREWLPMIGLPEYIDLFATQGYYTVDEVQSLTWEDFEDIGIKKLGHLKRLGLAIKKLKDHQFGRFQSDNGQQQLVTVSVHHNRTGAQAVYDGLQPHQAPPPPAPTSSFHPAGAGGLCDHYSTWRRLSHPYTSICSESRSQKPAVQVRPHYRSAVANEMDPYCLQGCGKQSSGFDLDGQQAKPIQLNLYSPSRILSEGFQKHADIKRQASMPPTKILSTADTSISSDSEDYPPPPAPLACEGSIRLLRSAFRESAVAAAAGSGVAGGDGFDQHFNEASSLSLNEQLPFANDNCGTIKSREGFSVVHKNNGKLAPSNSLSQPCTPRRNNHGVFADDTEISSYSTTTSNGDVLNDIGSMLQNLTDELDAMLLPSETVRYSPPCKEIPLQQHNSSKLQT